ncbi:MAG TPA: enoyl-CoA hydratase-related protein [Acidimicrobiia bacterium]|jgi:enoyl-CoA hydratase
MDNVLLEAVDPHVTLVTLNRPDRLNALNYELAADLHDALDRIGADRDCKVVILTGAGRGFCAGLDLKDWGTPPGAGEHAHSPVGVGGQEFLANLTVHLRATPQIVIAAVNGPAFGGGLSLACATDVRIAATSARFCSAYIRTGLSGTDIGITYLLPRIVGAGYAFDMIVSGREVDATTAERIGLATRLSADGSLLDDARELARTIAGYTTTGLLLTKEVMWHNLDNPSMTAAIALENRNQNLASRTPEVQEHMEQYMAPRRAKD